VNTPLVVARWNWNGIKDYPERPTLRRGLAFPTFRCPLDNDNDPKLKNLP
jgi:hypothetical protein